MNNMAGYTAQPGHAVLMVRIEAPLLKRIAELEAANEVLKSHIAKCEAIPQYKEARKAEVAVLRARIAELEKDAARYRALIDNCRSKYIWNHVFTDEHRALGNDVASVLDALAEMKE